MPADRSRLPDVRARTRLGVPGDSTAAPVEWRRRMDGRTWRVPLFPCSSVVRAGAAYDPADRPGLAAITGDLLDEGCGELDALALHEALGRLGAQLDTEVGADATLVGLTTLERSQAPAMALLAEMLASPRLETADFERVRDLRLNRLLQLRDMPPAVAERVFTERLYGAHPTDTCRSAPKSRCGR